MTRILLSILITFLAYYFGRQYSDTFFAGWIACLLVDLIDKVIKAVDDK